MDAFSSSPHLKLVSSSQIVKQWNPFNIILNIHEKWDGRRHNPLGRIWETLILSGIYFPKYCVQNTAKKKLVELFFPSNNPFRKVVFKK